jgi:undecaprenyl diphosphate synthase
VGAGGFHVAVVLDGDGRWAREHGREPGAGHEAGAEAVRRLVRAAPAREIDLLTLYAFPAEVWRRPRHEVAALLGLLERYLTAETPTLREMGVALRVLGRRDRLPPTLRTAVEGTEAATAGGEAMTLRLAVDYSSRHALAQATRRVVRDSLASRPLLSGAGLPGPSNGAGRRDPGVDPGTLARALAAATHAPVADVDLLVRTGGERRLGDFLLWECAYAELVFSDVLWPDFDAAELDAALREYRSRDRRFGRVAAAT